jgi:hypothetical protein
MSKKSIVGDLFEIQLDPSNKRFLQYVGDDASQLHSNVVRVYRETYGSEDPLDVYRVIGGKIDFHVHVLLPSGLKLNVWCKCGNAPPSGDLDMLFRDRMRTGKYDFLYPEY